MFVRIYHNGENRVSYLRKAIALFVAVGFVVTVAFIGVSIRAEQSAKKLRIVYTTNTMGYLEPCG